VDAQRHLERARELLERGRPELAESALSDAIDSAVAAEDLVLLTRARMALGELLVQEGREEEALPFLQAVVRTEIADGSVDAEVKLAAQVLRRVRGIPE
jgi:predicted negative regulator of RcsB-dependent stress response